MSIEERFVAVSDVLGFTRLIETTSLRELSERYCRLTEAARPRNLSITTQSLSTSETNSATTDVGHAVFSDTILFWSSSDHWSVQAFFEHLTTIISESVHHALPLRVGIAYGKCEVNVTKNIYIGTPIVNAYRTEQQQEWIGGACHFSCLDNPWFCYYAMLEFDMVVEYPVPTKTPDPIDLAVNWVTPYNGITELADDFINILTEAQRNSDSTAGRVKWENTLTFFHWCFARRAHQD